MIEVFINDMPIDIDPDETIAGTYGNISFGELNKRKGIKTNTWEAPFTTANKLVFDSAEVPGSDSDVPYRRGTIRITNYGVAVFEGFCSLEEAQDGYSIQCYAGASDFYTEIKNAKLRDLDLSLYDHIWNEVSITNSWTNTSGYNYAYVHYGKVWGPQISSVSPYTISPDYLLPQVFFHTIIKKIASELGYVLQGKVLTNPRFLNHMIIAGVWPLTFSYGGAITLNQFLPDVAQSKIWLDFANMYGLMFDINPEEGIIQCDYIDDMLFNDPEDWSSKVDKSERSKTQYRFDDFGQLSYLRYKFDENDGTGVADVINGYEKEITIDDHNLQQEADIYKSEFYMIQQGTIDLDVQNYYANMIETKPGKTFEGVWNSAKNYGGRGFVYYQGSYYENLTAAGGSNTNKVPPSEPTYWKPIKDSDVWQYKSRAMYGSLRIEGSTIVTIGFDTPVNVTRIITNDKMSWPYIYDNHYRVFKRIIKKTKRVQKLMKLSYADISQIDFTTAKLIDNELYILEEISQFKLNEKDSTLCQFIRL